MARLLSEAQRQAYPTGTKLNKPRGGIKMSKPDAENKKTKGKSDEKPLGTAKGVETLFRNAYRAELDMLALAEPRPTS